MLLKDYLNCAKLTDLTIISASFNSSSWLNLNLALTEFLNPEIKIYWIVAQNSPLEDRVKDLLNEKFIVIEGPLITNEEKKALDGAPFNMLKR